jgi:hypothetical protein
MAGVNVHILDIPSGATSAVVLVTSFLSLGTSLADKVGVAAAVKPDATSQPPGGDASTLRIGKSVVYNERIDTSRTGQVQVLLLDLRCRPRFEPGHRQVRL